MMPGNLSLPIGPISEARSARAIQSPSEYTSVEVQHWSRIVRSASGVVILTPEYNWGIPGHLKNLLDHLYHEWSGKPVLVITYGGNGGSRCAEQLCAVLQGGLKANLVCAPIRITLPEEYISGDKRVSRRGEDDPFLQTYKRTIAEGMFALVNSQCDQWGFQMHFEYNESAA